MKEKLAIMLAIGFTLYISVSCMLFGPQRGPLTFQPDRLPEAQVGAPFEAKISIGGNVTPAGAFSVQKNTLPPGLMLETLEGQNAAHIVGTPTAAGTYKFTISVWCYGTNVSGQTGEKEYTLVVH
jgi:hypothetical protein